MLPSGPSTPLGGAQPVPSSLLRSNSGMLGGQGGPMPSQGAYPTLIPPRPHYNNVNMLGNVPNAHSLLNQSFGNGVVDPGLQGPNGQNAHRGGMDTGGAEPDSLSGAGMGYNPSQSSSFAPTNTVNAVSVSRVQDQQFSDQAGNQMLVDQQPSNSQQREPQTFQHPQQPMQPFSTASSNQPSQQQQQQFRSIRGGLAGVGPVKLETQVNNDQHGLQQQQLQSLRGLGHVKLEPQHLQPMRSQPHVKMESQNSEQSMFMQQQQQQLLLSRQTSQAAAAAQLNLLQQHRLLQLQQQQQQQHQLLKAHPQQRPQMQQQFQAQNLPLRSPVKPVHEVGACARRVTQYIYQQRNRPEDNNIEFWRKFVADFFAPNSKKKWCVSMYGSGRQTTGVFPQDVWHCEICNRKPGRGFEAAFEVLPRLFKIKYESGTLEELLYVDMPREYHNSSGQIVLDYAKAIQESVFEQLRVVRDGQLRIVFSSDLKICSWEFCARRHEELIPRRLLIPQVSQLGAATQKYQAATQNASSNASVSDLQGNCNMFLASAKQLAKALEVPSVNDLGYSKRYVRCLQISEVVNSMKDLIDYSRATGTGPIESLVKFPRRNTSSGFRSQNQSSEDQQQQQQLQQHPSSQSIQQQLLQQHPSSQSIQQQLLQQHPSSQSIQQQQLQQHPSSQSIQQQSQMMQQEQPRMQNSNIEQASTSQGAGMQLGTTNGLASVNSPLNTSSASTPNVTVSGHQNSTVSRPQNPMNSTNSPYATASMPSPVSTGTMQQSPSHSNPPFRSPTPPPSNNSSLQPPSNNALSNTSAHMNSAPSPSNVSMLQQQQQSALMSNGDPTNSQSSVQKIIQEMMLSNQLNGAGGMSISSMRNDMKNVNGILNGPNYLVGNGPTNSNQGMVFSGMGGVMGQAAMLNGVRAAMGGNPIAMNGRVGMAAMGREQAISHHQQQDLSNQLSGFGSVNGFNNVQFDWKPSP